ncbi:hypothetical protein HED60_22915 [Planctomycetales bacterium ZRK34]|nr:hypothetical protein HED60_22915 [Planctomycetales bacterium ZRK34]
MAEPRLQSQASDRRAVDDRDVEATPDPVHHQTNQRLCEMAKAIGIEHAEHMTREQLLAILEPGPPKNVVNEPAGPNGPAPPAAAPDFKPH